MRLSTAFVISVGIGMALQSVHDDSAREAAATLGPAARSFGEFTDADVTPRVEAHAADAMRRVDVMVKRVRRCICVQRKIRVEGPDRYDEVAACATKPADR